MVIDCRRSNCYFDPPAGVELCSGTALAQLELGPSDTLYCAQCDIQTAFYHMELPSQLRKYFGLSGARAGDLGISSLGGSKVTANTWVYARLRVVPMGWTWALFICQKVHERAVAFQGIDPALRVVDGEVAPPLDNGAHTEYVDNFAALALEPERANSWMRSVRKRLMQLGLPVHDVEEATSDIRLFGWQIDGIRGKVAPTRERGWRLRYALLEVCRRGRASGREIEKLVGHATFIALLRREILSVFASVYSFIRARYDVRSGLWPSVVCELTLFANLIPLVYQDLRAEWTDDVIATDASEWGLGAVIARCSPLDVARCGRLSERWRFRLSDARGGARKQAGVVSRSGDRIEGDVSRVERPAASSFEEVPDVILRSRWRLVGRSRWKRQEHINVLEARALCYGVNRLARRAYYLGKRALLLCDSMVVTLASAKGRSSASALVQTMRRIAALLLATGISLHVRWLPSERNPSDAASRGATGPGYLGTGKFAEAVCAAEIEPRWSGRAEEACEALEEGKLLESLGRRAARSDEEAGERKARFRSDASSAAREFSGERRADDASPTPDTGPKDAEQPLAEEPGLDLVEQPPSWRALGEEEEVVEGGGEGALDLPDVPSGAGDGARLHRDDAGGGRVCLQLAPLLVGCPAHGRCDARGPLRRSSSGRSPCRVVGEGLLDDWVFPPGVFRSNALNAAAGEGGASGLEEAHPEPLPLADPFRIGSSPFPYPCDDEQVGVGPDHPFVFQPLLEAERTSQAEVLPGDSAGARGERQQIRDDRAQPFSRTAARRRRTRTTSRCWWTVLSFPLSSRHC